MLEATQNSLFGANLSRLFGARLLRDRKENIYIPEKENRMKKNEDIGLLPLVQIPESANYSLPDDNLLSFYNDLEERLLWVTDGIDSCSLNIIHYILKWNREDKEIEVSARKPFVFSFLVPVESLMFLLPLAILFVFQKPLLLVSIFRVLTAPRL